MRNFYITSFHDIYEDDFNEGEGKHVNTFDLKGNIKAENPIEAVKTYIQEVAGYDVSDDATIDVHDERPNVAFWGATVDNDNVQASESEIERWKEGKMKLYSDHMEITVQELIECNIKETA